MKPSVFISAPGLVLIALCIAMPAHADSDNDAITISRSDFYKAPKDVLEIVERLEAMTLGSRENGTQTARYAREYQRLQDAVAKARPPLSKWEAADRKRVEAIAQPDARAWKALDKEKAEALREQAAKTEAALREREIAERQQAASRRENAEEQRAQKQLDLQQAQIDLLEARTDNYYNRGGYYNNNWWWNTGGPIHGRPPGWRPNNGFYQPRPAPPQSYEPAPQFSYSPARMPGK